MLTIISDIHANLAALEAVLADADARGATQIISLGDVVGYNGQPDECIGLLKSRGIVNILGNHDSYVTTGQNCTRSRVVAGIIDDHLTMISDENRAWLAGSVDRVVEGDMLLLHGGPQDPVDQYIYEVDETLFPEGVRMLFVGHTHVQAVLRFGDRTFCNPGSVGQPRDGDPRAAYVTVQGGVITPHRVPYDIDRTVAAMQARGYEPFLYEGLYKGAQIGGRVDTITRRD
jgi:predicted phosphodiesterase